jgi:DNA-binding transcriptional LysR family regulator
MSGTTHQVLQNLIAHKISVALIEAPAYRPDLKIEDFGEDELTLIVKSDHRWARKGPIRAAELVHEPILLREVGSGMRHFVEDYLERNGVLRQQLKTSLDFDSTEAIISAVQAGLGVGFVPGMAIEDELKVGSIKAIQLENGPIRRRLSFALLNGPEPKGPVSQLLELLRRQGATPWQIENAAQELEESRR